MFLAKLQLSYIPLVRVASGLFYFRRSVASSFSRRSGLLLQQRKLLSDRLASELGYPAVGIVEEPDGAELRAAAHVEPVLGAGRHADPVVGFAEHLQHFITDVLAEQALPLHEEAHLIFAVGVFRKELLAQSFAIGVLGCHPDRIHRGVVAPGLHSLDLGGVGGEHGRCIGTSREFNPGRPALEADAAFGQLGRDQGRVVTGELGQRMLAVGGLKNLQMTHRVMPHAASP